MKEKIDWYQEVLDLEPGSKVFFPLAKLLADNGLMERSVQTLQHGLDRHPEFIEARLYLIDLLFRHGEVEQCRMQLAQLEPLFARYIGFWQAWGRSAVSEQEGDAGLALSFLAASFKQGGLSLADVLAKGLESTFESSQNSGAGLSRKSDSMSSVPCMPLASDAHNAAQTPSELASPLIVEEGDSREVPSEALPPEAMAACNASVDAPLPPDHKADEPRPASEKTEEALAAMLAPRVAAGPVLPAGPRVSLSSPVQPASSVTPVAHTAHAVSPEVTADLLQAEEELEDNEETEERFSVRTRSMAEVLAEQGDYAGALEIYQELSGQAVSAEEAADLQYRISTLTSHLGASQESVVEPESQPAPGKHRVLSVLEALAERLESRVNG